MPLPPASVNRQRVHVRSVQLCGYKREDGLWDVEAHLTDTKDQDYPLSSGLRPAGEPVHDMWVRVTIDREFNIQAAEARTDGMPYAGLCDSITPDYGKLVGLNLFHGFRRAVRELFGDVAGCSHLTELVMVLPTAAIQTFASDMKDNEDHGAKPYQLDRCHALESSSEAVRRYYPRWYRGQKTG